MSKSSFPVPTLQSAYAYTPKFELWMNGLVWQAIYNVINSYNSIEMAMESQQGLTRSMGHAPHDVFIGRVKVLEDTVMAIEKPDLAYETDTAPKEKEDLVDRYHRIYRALLALLQRYGHVRFKPPRDVADD